MSENVPATIKAAELVSRGFGQLTEQQVALIKDTIAKGATDNELHMFLEVAHTTDLNPFARPPEIYFFKIGGKVVMPVGIDGLRRKAAESGDYMGQVGPFWCGDDGVWKDVWLDPKATPAACKVGVYRRGNPEPTWAVVKWSEFAKDTTFWRKLGVHMIAKCAEAHALRKAAPRVAERLQAAGAQIINGEYVIAQAEHLERQRALPQSTPPGDLEQELFGTEPEIEPVPWTAADLARLKTAVTDRELSSKQWRRLLGLSDAAELKDVRALGTVGQVIALLQAAFAKAVAGEPVAQAKLGF